MDLGKEWGEEKVIRWVDSNTGRHPNRWKRNCRQSYINKCTAWPPAHDIATICGERMNSAERAHEFGHFAQGKRLQRARDVLHKKNFEQWGLRTEAKLKGKGLRPKRNAGNRSEYVLEQQRSQSTVRRSTGNGGEKGARLGNSKLQLKKEEELV